MKRIPCRSRWIAGAAAAVCLALGGATFAQAQEGEWYIGANMPLMFIDDSGLHRQHKLLRVPQGPSEATATVRTEHDTGFKLGAVLGHHLESNLRVEGEIFFARAEVSRLTHTGITLPGLPLPPDLLGDVDIPVSGTGDQFGAMVNLWYDFDTGDNWTPYVGGGLGLIRIDQSDLSYDPNAGNAFRGSYGCGPESAG